MTRHRFPLLHGPAIALLCLLAACGTLPPEGPSGAEPLPAAAESGARVDETAMLPLLGYHYLLQRMTAAQLAHERQTLAALPPSPSLQVRQAMVLGQSHSGADLARAQAILDAVLRSDAPEAASLHPLAKLLATHYRERARIEAQNERLGRQLKESQRKCDALQEKIDALSDIERSIPFRPRGGKPTP